MPLTEFSFFVGDFNKNVSVARLRPAVADDSGFLFKIFCDVKWAEFQYVDAAIAGQLLEMQFRAQRTSYESRYDSLKRLIIEGEDKEPIGYLLLNVSGEAAHIVDFALARAFRGRGIGAGVVQGIQRHYRKITLSVARQNPAVALYRRCGFVEAGGSDVDLLMAWGEAL